MLTNKINPLEFRSITALRAAFTNDLKEFSKNLDKFADKDEAYLRWKLSEMDDLSLYQALFDLEDEIQEYEEENQRELQMPIEYVLSRKEFKRREGQRWDDKKWEIYDSFDFETLSDYSEGYRPSYTCVYEYTAKEEWAWEDENFYCPPTMEDEDEDEWFD
jgi:hypothetical protein